MMREATKQETLKMLEDYKGGMTTAEIAEKYHMCLYAVRYRFIQAGLKHVYKKYNDNHLFHHKITAEDMPEILKMRQEGMSYEAIAFEMEVTPDTLRRGMKKCGYD